MSRATKVRRTFARTVALLRDWRSVARHAGASPRCGGAVSARRAAGAGRLRRTPDLSPRAAPRERRPGRGRTRLVDSMLNAAEPRSPEEAEALFWRATTRGLVGIGTARLPAADARARAVSPRAGDAMLRLAQGEAARGDRDAAMRYLERLMREAPESPARAEAGLWQGRLLLERGSRGPGVHRAAVGAAAAQAGLARTREPVRLSPARLSRLGDARRERPPHRHGRTAGPARPRRARARAQRADAPPPHRPGRCRSAR